MEHWEPVRLSNFGSMAISLRLTSVAMLQSVTLPIALLRGRISTKCTNKLENHMVKIISGLDELFC
jgi:hypothetical protein